MCESFLLERWWWRSGLPIPPRTHIILNYQWNLHPVNSRKQSPMSIWRVSLGPKAHVPTMCVTAKTDVYFFKYGFGKIRNLPRRNVLTAIAMGAKSQPMNLLNLWRSCLNKVKMGANEGRTKKVKRQWEILWYEVDIGDGWRLWCGETSLNVVLG